MLGLTCAVISIYYYSFYFVEIILQYFLTILKIISQV